MKKLLYILGFTTLLLAGIWYFGFSRTEGLEEIPYSVVTNDPNVESHIVYSHKNGKDLLITYQSDTLPRIDGLHKSRYSIGNNLIVVKNYNDEHFQLVFGESSDTYEFGVHYGSPSTDISDGGKTLTVHKPDKYYDEILQQWVFENPTDTLSLSFDKQTGNIKYSYKNDRYYAIARLFIVVDLMQGQCNAQGWSWIDNRCILWWDNAKQFIQDNNIDYDLTIDKMDTWWKYSILLENIPQNQAEKVLFIGLHLEDSYGLTWDDVKMDDQAIVIKDKIRLSYQDLIDSGHTVQLYDKRTVLIGNVNNQTSIFLDPTMVADGATEIICGYNATFTKIVVNNTGTLEICDYDGSPTNCEGGGVQSGCGYVNISLGSNGNFTVESGSSVNCDSAGYIGGASCASDYCKAYQGESYNGTGGQYTSSNAGGGGGGKAWGTEDYGYGGGAGFGGSGGTGSKYGSGTAGVGGDVYGDNSTVLRIGSGGGGAAVDDGYTSTNGYKGGAGFMVNVDGGYIGIFGIIDCDGEPTATTGSTAYGGAGSGGHIILYGKTIDTTGGSLNVTGGDASLNVYSGGGGGGGRISIFYATFTNTSMTANAYGGTAGNGNHGALGTYWAEVTSFNTAPTASNLTEPTDPFNYLSGKTYYFNFTACDDDGLDDIDVVTREWNGVNDTDNTTQTEYVNASCAIFSNNMTDLGVQAATSYKFYVNDTSAEEDVVDGTFTISKLSTSTNLLLNGTDSNKFYNKSTVGNFTVDIDASGKTAKLDSNYTGFATQSGVTALNNYTTLVTGGVWWNLTGYFDGDENYSESSETHYFNVSVPMRTFQWAQSQSYNNTHITYNLTVMVYNNHSAEISNILVEPDSKFSDSYTISSLSASSDNQTNMTYIATRGAADAILDIAGAILYDGGDGTSNELTMINPIDPPSKAVGDTCDCPDSGDWEVDCSEYCVISDDCDIGSNNLIFYGVGEIYMNADLIVGDMHIGAACVVVFADGKTIVYE